MSPMNNQGGLDNTPAQIAAAIASGIAAVAAVSPASSSTTAAGVSGDKVAAGKELASPTKVADRAIVDAAMDTAVGMAKFPVTYGGGGYGYCAGGNRTYGGDPQTWIIDFSWACLAGKIPLSDIMCNLAGFAATMGSYSINPYTPADSIAANGAANNATGMPCVARAFVLMVYSCYKVYGSLDAFNLYETQVKAITDPAATWVDGSLNIAYSIGGQGRTAMDTTTAIDQQGMPFIDPGAGWSLTPGWGWSEQRFSGNLTGYSLPDAVDYYKTLGGMQAMALARGQSGDAAYAASCATLIGQITTSMGVTGTPGATSAYLWNATANLWMWCSDSANVQGNYLPSNIGTAYALAEHVVTGDQANTASDELATRFVAGEFTDGWMTPSPIEGSQGTFTGIGTLFARYTGTLYAALAVNNPGLAAVQRHTACLKILAGDAGGGGGAFAAGSLPPSSNVGTDYPYVEDGADMLMRFDEAALSVLDQPVPVSDIGGTPPSSTITVGLSYGTGSLFTGTALTVLASDSSWANWEYAAYVSAIGLKPMGLDVAIGDVAPLGSGSIFDSGGEATITLTYTDATTEVISLSALTPGGQFVPINTADGKALWLWRISTANPTKTLSSVSFNSTNASNGTGDRFAVFGSQPAAS